MSWETASACPLDPIQRWTLIIVRREPLKRSKNCLVLDVISLKRGGLNKKFRESNVSLTSSLVLQTCHSNRCTKYCTFHRNFQCNRTWRRPREGSQLVQVPLADFSKRWVVLYDGPIAADGSVAY
jgi:hypothetical protein